jgi:hypothetical protein
MPYHSREGEQLSRALTKPKERAIALLFICIDELPFEDIWRKWMDDEEAGVKVTVLIHAKHPQRVKSEWMRQHLLPESYKPTWGSIELVRAATYLVDECLKQDRSVGRMCFLSESCVPVKSLRACTRALFSSERSWLDAKNKPNNGFATMNQFEKASPAIPKRHLWKSDQWIALTRRHAQAIADIDQRQKLPYEAWKYFSSMRAADEMYFATMLACLGVLWVGGEAISTEQVPAEQVVSSTSPSAATEAAATEEPDLAAVEPAPAPAQAPQDESAVKCSKQDGVMRQKLTYVDWQDAKVFVIVDHSYTLARF